MKLTESIARLIPLVLPGAAALGVLATVPAGQLEREADATTSRQVVTGRVFLPDGSPAVGAVVVTSAGGHALTGTEGSFTLTVDLPLDVESLEVTALADGTTGSESLVASARIVPAALSPTTPIGQLALTLSSNCHPRWLPTFGAQPGVNGEVEALGVFDDGGGPALYAGGVFGTAGGVVANYIAKWDGSSWTALGGGMNGTVSALTAYDDGSGPALYAGGSFSIAGGIAVTGIAKWDGASWSAPGGGMNGYVRALAVFDDGGGPALYAGGGFTVAGGVPASQIAKWDGASWSALGSGVSGVVWALAVHDDGNGPALYAGGDFPTAGGVAANRIAKWDGANWSALGSGTTSTVRALTSYDAGGGPALYAGGAFTTMGGVPASRIARWDGATWSALDSGANYDVHALTVYDDGGGPALCAGGGFTVAGGVAANRVAKWNGSSWSALGSGTTSWVEALSVYDDGSGQRLCAGGSLTSADDLEAYGIAKWDGASWAAFGDGNWVNGRVASLKQYDDGNGPALYAGGWLTRAGGIPVNGIARWDGSSWSALGDGVNGSVYALAVYDDGSGPALYAGGQFTTAGAVGASNIAKWGGSSWSALGSGIGGGPNPLVNSLVVYDDGGGPALYAGGLFTTAGGVGTSNIAKWDGSSWLALGSGISGGIPPWVSALAVYDDGGGPALYAGGQFTTAGGVGASDIAKWDGSGWSALGSGTSGVVNPSVSALVVYDDGSGPALCAGGSFTSVGGVAADRVAKWDGSSWSPLGSGLGPTVYCLAVHDYGTGPGLYAGGELGRRVARWNGSTWTTLGIGISQAVVVLASWDDGHGPALYAGGDFVASPAGDSHLAKWGCRPKSTVKERKL